ncbi:MAG TPA: metalloregulator ArsR/SmtB family transcription factor [Acidobacteriota bacterium]|nr:metalloregulator ArsR/SmtB family transcription factor [Acidobacteriota bacterium]
MLATFTALAEPNRLRIVELLRSGPRPVGEIGRRLRLRQPQASKHLRILKEAGLVAVRPEAQRRLYELRADRLLEIDAWLEPYRRYWNARLDALERHLETMDREAPRRRRRRTP